ncbi:hypothetical protein [Paenarthrobacter ureafaciens]|uniref:hypothetical protein n=1 Tax=Paenarthrobacter ureafaciens TaxID=37931 RepID=UPI001C2B9D9E|nr:hypothetical protein [Paenarthrobacter ureafaciens]
MDLRGNRHTLKLVRALNQGTPGRPEKVARGLPGRRSGALSRKKHAGRVALLYRADRTHALPGDTVIFTAWVTNDSRSHLRQVRLIPRSFTNEGMDSLNYTSNPGSEELEVPSLEPGQTMMRTFSYRVTDADHLHGGSLISAMQVQATCRGEIIADEHDAIVSLNGAPTGWMSGPARPEVAYRPSSRGSSLKPRRRPGRLG